MTPAARVQAAIGVLDQVFDGMPAEKALTHWARGARYAGSKDRAAVRDFVFQAIRCRDSYAVLGGGQTGRQVMIGQIRAEGGQPETYFTGSPYAPAPLTVAERAIAAKADPDLNTDLPPDLPAWLYGKFEESLGAEGAAEAAGMLRRRAPVMLRVNGRKADPVDVIASLATDGVSASAVPEIETALHVTDGARRVGQTQAYLSGEVELQDAHSQAAMVCLEVRDGARVLDYCAGGGGKTLALAARINATYFAHDANPRRMKDLPDRAHRAGVAVDLVQGEAVRRHGP
ncbi:MAG: RsmB/NOP family class I SAM-dependent RNA methyltransferase, partial [Pseudomonadota bacterium]